MKRESSRFHTVLWIASVALICTRYLCAAIMCAGALGDKGTFNMALDTLGPFLPVTSLVCLFGALLFTLTDLFVILRDRKDSKDK